MQSYLHLKGFETRKFMQSLSEDESILMGITLMYENEDEDTIGKDTIGTIGPKTQEWQYLGGPLHGVKWSFGESLPLPLYCPRGL